jgi:hypothetical protein
MRTLRLGLALVTALGLFTFVGCGDSGSTTSGSGGGSTTGTGGAAATGTGGGASTTTSGSGGSTTTTTGTGGMASFALTSTAYAEGETIPMKYECTSAGGQSVSPPLAWTAGPAGTLSYAIVMRDLDYQNGFLHWVMWDIPASSMSLPEGVEQVYAPSMPAGSHQAPFNQSIVGYYGPCSPNSVNTYEITVYALDVATVPGLTSQSTKPEAEAAILDAAIASATLSGES